MHHAVEWHKATTMPVIFNTLSRISTGQVMLGCSTTIGLCCLQDVAVSVVGKYCYHMHSPAEHQTLPVIVDIILVGRTKIITLHSSIWLINSTDRHVAFRLHVPITPLVAPARVGPPNRKQRTTDHVIGPLEPNAGTLLYPIALCSQHLADPDWGLVAVDQTH